MSMDTLDTNLIASQKKTKVDTEAPLPLAEARVYSRGRKIAKIVGYILLFIFSLVFFLLLKFPDSLLTSYTLTKLNETTPYRWQAEQVKVRFFFLPHIHFEKLELEPKFPGAGMSLAFQWIDVYPSLFSMIPTGGAITPAASFSAEAYGAKLKGSVNMAANSSFSLRAENVDLSKLTPLTDQGIFLKGILTDAKIELDMEGQKLARSDGSVSFTGKAFQVDPAAFNAPMPLPFLDLGAVTGQAKVQKGKLHIEKLQIGDASKDIDLKVDGDIQLADPVNFSRMELKLRLKPADKLKVAIPALDGMLGALAAKRADGYWGMRLNGTLTAVGVPTPDAN